MNNKYTKPHKNDQLSLVKVTGIFHQVSTEFMVFKTLLIGRWILMYLKHIIQTLTLCYVLNCCGILAKKQDTVT